MSSFVTPQLPLLTLSPMSRWRHERLITCFRRSVSASTASFCRQRTVKTTRTCPATSLTVWKCISSTTTGIFTISSSPSRRPLPEHLRYGLAPVTHNHVNYIHLSTVFVMSEATERCSLESLSLVDVNNTTSTSLFIDVVYTLKSVHCFVNWLLYGRYTWYILQYLVVKLEFFKNN